MTKFGAAKNEMKRLTAKFAQGTPAEYSFLLERAINMKPSAFVSYPILFSLVIALITIDILIDLIN